MRTVISPISSPAGSSNAYCEAGLGFKLLHFSLNTFPRLNILFLPLRGNGESRNPINNIMYTITLKVECKGVRVCSQLHKVEE